MPAPHSPEFCQRAIELARMRDKPIRLVAKHLGISEISVCRPTRESSQLETDLCRCRTGHPSPRRLISPDPPDRYV
jgi:hypothetical protein